MCFKCEATLRDILREGEYTVVPRRFTAAETRALDGIDASEAPEGDEADAGSNPAGSTNGGRSSTAECAVVTRETEGSTPPGHPTTEPCTCRPPCADRSTCFSCHCEASGVEGRVVDGSTPDEATQTTRATQARAEVSKTPRGGSSPPARASMTFIDENPNAYIDWAKVTQLWRERWDAKYDEQFITGLDYAKRADGRLWCTSCLRYERPGIQTHYMADYFTWHGSEGCD